MIIGLCHVAFISAFYFQYFEETPQGALHSFAIFIEELQSDLLVQDDEILCGVLLAEKRWIEGKGKLASIQLVQRHRADTEQEVNSLKSFKGRNTTLMGHSTFICRQL